MTSAALPIPRRVAVVGSTRTSRASFAWVNAHGKSPQSYRRLNEDARRAHARRSDANDAEWFVRTGAGAGTAALLRTQTRSPRLKTSSGEEGFLVRIDAGDHPVDRIRSVAGLQVRPESPGRIAAQSLSIEAGLRRTGVTASVRTLWTPLRAELIARDLRGDPDPRPAPFRP